MRLKQAARCAVVSWSPSAQFPTLMAAGTVAGALDATFNASASLEIFSMDLSDNGTEMPVRGSTTTEYRFHRLAWSTMSGRSHGLLAGGMDNGSVTIFDPSLILDNDSESSSPVISSPLEHGGPVRGLDFNPHQPQLLASGATESEIFIWDLSNPAAPSKFKPTSQKQPQASTQDITCLQWNRSHAHILASTSNAGISVIWDLRQKRPLVSFSDPNRRVTRCRALAWSPEQPTYIISASEDDAYPVLQLWDLRNTTSPQKELTGHTRGVLSCSWCPSDASLLLSCGKDDRTLCWNPATGDCFDVTSPAVSNDMMNMGSIGGNFDVQWSPKVPAIFSTASFEGALQIHSLQDVGTAKDDTFPDQQRKPLSHAPRWLQRPVGASFGFGGKLVSFFHAPAVAPPPGVPMSTSATKPIVSMTTIHTDTEIEAAAKKLRDALEGGPDEMRAFCDAQRANATDDVEKMTWQVMHVLLEPNPRQKLCEELGFSAESLTAEIEAIINAVTEVVETEEEKETEEKETEEEKEEEEKEEVEESPFGAVADDDPFSKIASSPQQSYVPEPITLVTDDGPVIEDFGVGSDDDAVTRAIIMGRYSDATEILMARNEWADALVVASCGGDELYNRVQAACLKARNKSYLRVAGAIRRHDLASLVNNAVLDSWRHVMCLLATYARGDEFPTLCKTLGARLDAVGNVDGAVTAYMCGGALGEVVKVWERERSKHNGDLQCLLDKICLFEAASDIDDVGGDSVVPTIMHQYAGLLASSGWLDFSWKFLKGPASSLDHRILQDRVYHSLAYLPADERPAFPFEVETVKPEPAVQSEPKPIPAPVEVARVNPVQYNSPQVYQPPVPTHTQPVPTQPVHTQPVHTQPVHTQPVHTQPPPTETPPTETPPIKAYRPPAAVGVAQTTKPPPATSGAGAADVGVIQSSFDSLVAGVLERGGTGAARPMNDAQARLKALYADLTANKMAPELVDLLKKMAASVQQRNYPEAEAHLKSIVTHHTTAAHHFSPALKRILTKGKGLGV